MQGLSRRRRPPVYDRQGGREAAGSSESQGLALISYSDQALRDFERIFDYLATENPARAATIVAAIGDAVSVLAWHPLIGRPAEQGLHELVISRGRAGYVALYRDLETADVIFVLALRHQREAGYEISDEW